MKDQKYKENLLEIRKEIDSIDHDILKLLKKRYALVLQVAKIKAKFNLPVYQKSRWISLLENRKMLARKMKLDPIFIEKIFKSIHRDSLNIQVQFKKRGK